MKVAHTLSKVFTTVVVAVTVASCGVDQAATESSLSSGSIGGPCPSNISWNTSAHGKFKHMTMFAQSRLGQRVGSGQCAALAEQALHAMPAVRYDQVPAPNDDYKWGDLSAIFSVRGSRGSLRPGMVLQFRDAKFEWRNSNGGTSWRTAAHHTAIVSAVSTDGRHACVLEQNIGGVKKVMYGYYPMKKMTAGMVWAYTPIRL